MATRTTTAGPGSQHQQAGRSLCERQTLQGTPVAEFPAMIQPYHHRSEISAEALPLLGLSNELRLAADASDEFRVRA